MVEFLNIRSKLCSLNKIPFGKLVIHRGRNKSPHICYTRQSGVRKTCGDSFKKSDNDVLRKDSDTDIYKPACIVVLSDKLCEHISVKSCVAVIELTEHNLADDLGAVCGRNDEDDLVDILTSRMLSDISDGNCAAEAYRKKIDLIFTGVFLCLLNDFLKSVNDLIDIAERVVGVVIEVFFTDLIGIVFDRNMVEDDGLFLLGTFGGRSVIVTLYTEIVLGSAVIIESQIIDCVVNRIVSLFGKSTVLLCNKRSKKRNNKLENKLRNIEIDRPSGDFLAVGINSVVAVLVKHKGS